MLVKYEMIRKCKKKQIKGKPNFCKKIEYGVLADFNFTLESLSELKE